MNPKVKLLDPRADTNERVDVTEAIRRDKELSSRKVMGRTHEEVMEAARRALKEIAA